MRTIDVTKIDKEITLQEGSRIVLLDLLAAPSSVPDEEVERNIYRLSAEGSVEWQIDVDSGAYPRTPFTGVWLNEEGQLMVYRWDGVEYLVNAETGVAVPYRLAK